MNDDRKGPMTLEGSIWVSNEDNGFYEITLDGVNVAEWAGDKIHHDARSNVKAVLMIEDKEFINAQGQISIYEGEGGYSSWTPGMGPRVTVWDKATYHDIADALEEHPGCNAVLSLEIIV